MRILLVEDEFDLAESVADFLESHGCEVTCAPDGLSGKRFALAATGGVQEFDALVVDVGLPRLDGLSMVREIRAAGCQTPVLFLTARDTMADTLDGFAAGADDYQVKPCALPELLARLKAVVTRYHQTAQPSAAKRLTVNDLVIDRQEHRAWCGNQEIELTPTCFTLLWTLTAASPAVVSRLALERAIWGDDTPPGSDPLRSHVHKLRRALDATDGNIRLHTIRGVGARLE